MTLEQIARFAEQPSSAIYDAVCRRYRIDPAHFIRDDYLAWQLRLALFWTNQPKASDAPDDEEQELMDEMTGLIHG